jgi:chemotaxis family two-component system sensor kinase Cph1
MSRLLQNLIANGIKYNDKKNPKIVLDCTQIDNNYVISIADNGIGISKEYNTKVYEIFKRLKTDNDSESVGMGLAVCKKIVEAHKGKIWHESQVGEGTTFYINLPLQRA